MSKTSKTFLLETLAFRLSWETFSSSQALRCNQSSKPGAHNDDTTRTSANSYRVSSRLTSYIKYAYTSSALMYIKYAYTFY